MVETDSISPPIVATDLGAVGSAPPGSALGAHEAGSGAESQNITLWKNQKE